MAAAGFKHNTVWTCIACVIVILIEKYIIRSSQAFFAKKELLPAIWFASVSQASWGRESGYDCWCGNPTRRWCKSCSFTPCVFSSYCKRFRSVYTPVFSRVFLNSMRKYGIAFDINGSWYIPWLKLYSSCQKRYSRDWLVLLHSGPAPLRLMRSPPP